MARINKTQYVLLGILRMRGPSTGYEMKSFIDESLNYFWMENYGHIYPVLKKLEETGRVTCREEANPGKPDRKVYTITEAGASDLESWLSTPFEGINFKNELLLRLFLLPTDRDEEMIRMIRKERDHNRKLLEEYAHVEEHVRSVHGEQLNALLTLSYGRKFSEAVLEWCDEAVELLKEEKK